MKNRKQFKHRGAQSVARDLQGLIKRIAQNTAAQRKVAERASSLHQQALALIKDADDIIIQTALIGNDVMDTWELMRKLSGARYKRPAPPKITIMNPVR